MTQLRSIQVLCVCAELVACSCARKPQIYVDKAKQYFSEGKFEDAKLNASKAIQSAPKLGEGHYWLGVSEAKLGHVRPALVALSQAVQLMPDRDEPKIQLASLTLQAYLLNSRRPTWMYSQVEKLSGELLAKNPNSYDGLLLKSYLALTNRRPAEAVQALRQADQSKPSQPESAVLLVQALQQDSRPQEAEASAKQFIEQHRTFGPMYDILYSQYRGANRINDAETLLRLKIDADPKRPEYVLQLASHFASVNRPQEMRAAIDRFLQDPRNRAERHLQAGDFYAGIGNQQEALVQYRISAAADSGKRGVYQKRIASSLAAQNKPEEALNALSEVLAHDPKDNEANAMRVVLLLADANPEAIDKAVTQLRADTARYPEDYVIRLQLGQALLKKGDLEGARREFLEAIHRRPDYIDALLALAEISRRKADYKDVLNWTGKALALDPNHRASRLLHAGALVEERAYDEARFELLRLRQESPEDKEALLQLAIVNIRQNRFREAEKELSRQYRSGDTDLRVLLGLSELYTKQKKFEQAIQLLQREVSRSPQPSALRPVLALAAMSARRYDLAIEQYEKLLSDTKPSMELYLALGESYRVHGDSAQAIHSFQQAHRFAPADERALRYLCEAFRTASRTDEELLCYQALSKLSPRDPIVMNNLAFLMAERGGDLDQALELVKHAQQLAPANPAVLDTMGWVYLKKNMTGPAIELFERLVQQHPDAPVYNYHLGVALMRKGARAPATAALRKALANDPPPEVAVPAAKLLNER